MKFAIAAAVALSAAGALAGSASASARPRPNDVPAGSVHTETVPSDFQVYNDYASPERRYASGRAVVHYVVLGIDAPPLNDDDGDGVPDYVERLARAADTAIAYYERRGFRAIRPDTAGPDDHPDLYVSRFTPGTFGVSFPADAAEGGAFAVIANDLDPSATYSLASLHGTVAHELFHLVQFSYFPANVDPDLPPWTVEGSAAAMENRVYPELDDIVSDLQTRAWFVHADRPFTERSYAAQLLWRWLDARFPGLLPAFLARLGSRPAAGDGGTAFAETFARETGTRFADTFQRFAVAMADEYPGRIRPHLTVTRRQSRAYAGSVARDAVHYVRLPRTARSVSLTFGAPNTEATLCYRRASEIAGNAAAVRQLHPTVARGGRTLTFRLPRRLRRDMQASALTLIVSNGQPRNRLAYRLTVR